MVRVLRRSIAGIALFMAYAWRPTFERSLVGNRYTTCTLAAWNHQKPRTDWHARTQIDHRINLKFLDRWYIGIPLLAWNATTWTGLLLFKTCIAVILVRTTLPSHIHTLTRLTARAATCFSKFCFASDKSDHINIGRRMASIGKAMIQ